jgi:hypothetical protein
MAELVAAAAGAAAAASAAATGCDRLLHTVHGEGGELARDVGRGAVGALDLLLAADELLEMRLALHADVLVDRHGSDASATRSTGAEPGSRAALRVHSWGPASGTELERRS